MINRPALFMMNHLPAELVSKFTHFIEKQGVHSKNHLFYLKWLRFYFDFCQKYNFELLEKTSLSSFVKKLEDKNQPEGLRKQAQQSIELFWKMRLSIDKNIEVQINRDTKPLPSHTSLHSSKDSEYAQDQTQHSLEKSIILETTDQKPSFKLKWADWTGVYIELANSIRMRHYSEKTLKSYTIWTRKFQTYLKSKDPKQIGVDDVKAFLTYLAVEKNVSASSQNLAFNALLFVFRHVLHKEFGQVDGIVRAKKKPYIPVALSRSEIDTYNCLFFAGPVQTHAKIFR